MFNSKKDYILKIASDASIFRLVYLITLFFECIIYFDIAAIAVKCVVFVWAAYILWNNFIKDRNILRIKYKILLFLFLISVFITVMLHFRDNFLPNILAIYHTSLCFFVFYGMYAESDHKKVEREFIFLLKFFIIASTIIGIVGFIPIFFGVDTLVSKYYIGILRNRLIGIYTNENLLGLSSTISIIACHITFNRKRDGKNGESKAIIPVWLSLSCLFVNIVSLLLSDSNASFLCLIVYIVVMIFYKLFIVNKKNGIFAIAQKSILLLILCIVLTFGAFTFRGIFQNKVAVMIQDFHISQNYLTDNNTDMPEEKIEIQRSEKHNANNGQDVLIGRSKNMDNPEYDVSSGRLHLLKQSLTMFKHHPIMGIGRGNIVDYGERYIDGGLFSTDFHNGYITILVSYGIVGFTIFIIFFSVAILKMFRCLYTHSSQNRKDPFPNLFAITIAYCVYSLFEKTILSEITFMVVIFWAFLGYAFSYINKYIKL